MTKLLFCAECGDVVAPGQRDMSPRWCACKRHAVWWRDGRRGLLSVHDAWMPERSGGDGGKGWVIGLHNGVLTAGGLVCSTGSPVEEVPAANGDGTITLRGNTLTRKHWVERELADTPDSYLFKRANSLVVRIAPGASSDTQWEAGVPYPAGSQP